MSKWPGICTQGQQGVELCRGLEERCKQRLSLVRPELLALQGHGAGVVGFLSASVGWSLTGPGGTHLARSVWSPGQP